jgi:hypothetical protein
MTATAPQAAVSWSSVAKTSVRGLARLAVFWFCVRRDGFVARHLTGMRLDGRGAVSWNGTEGEG